MFILVGAVFFVPLFVLPQTPDVSEVNKQTLAALLVLGALIGAATLALMKRVLRFTLSWAHLAVGAMYVAWMLATVFSQDHFASVVGAGSQIAWSLASLLIGVVLYALITILRPRGEWMMKALLASGVLVGVAGLFQLLGAPIFHWLGSVGMLRGFTTIGTPNALTGFLMMVLPIAAARIIWSRVDEPIEAARPHGARTVTIVLAWLTVVVGCVVAICVDYWSMWLSMLASGVLLHALVIIFRRRTGQRISFVLPISFVLIALTFLLFRPPFSLPIPVEISPSWSASWSIARQTLSAHPLTGSGPGTWSMDYARFKDAAVNTSPYWNVRFDQAASAALTLLSTVGVLGATAWIGLIGCGLWLGIRALREESDPARFRETAMWFGGWVAAAGLMFLYPLTFSHQFLFWTLFSLLIVSASRRVILYPLNDTTARQWASTAIAIVCTVGCVVGGWMMVRHWRSEHHTALGANAFRSQQPIETAIAALERAVKLNPWKDAGYRNLAQAYLLRADHEFKRPTAERDNDVIQRLVAQAIETAKTAAERSPQQVENWSNLGFIFQSIAPFVRGSDEQAILAFQEASQREPLNPVFPNEMGKILILRADAFRTLFEASDAAVKSDARKQFDEVLAEAKTALEAAIRLKADYAPAHYNLGLVAERQGRLAEAITTLENVLRADPQNYGIAFQLGVLYLRHQDQVKALDMFEQLVAFDPASSNPNARWYLATAYENAGRYNDAIFQVQKMLERLPDDQAVQRRLTQLRELRDEQVIPSSTPAVPEPVEETVNDSSPSLEVKQP